MPVIFFVKTGKDLFFICFLKEVDFLLANTRKKINSTCWLIGDFSPYLAIFLIDIINISVILFCTQDLFPLFFFGLLHFL